MAGRLEILLFSFLWISSRSRAIRPSNLESRVFSLEKTFIISVPLRDNTAPSTSVPAIGHGAERTAPRPAMPTFRDRERDEAAAQAKRTQGQRDELKKRAAKRAKEREKAGLGASTTGGMNRPSGGGASERTSGSNPRASSASTQPQRPPRPSGPRETQWGLSPSEWTGDVGSELVTLQAQNLALRRERLAWEQERKRLEDAAKAAGAPQYGRVTTPSPPPASIKSQGVDTDDETEVPRERMSRGVPKPTNREGTQLVGVASSSRRNSSNPGSRNNSRPTSSNGSQRSVHLRPQNETIDDVFGGQENTPPRGIGLHGDDASIDSMHESPEASHTVFNAVQDLSGAEAMTALMLAEMRASRGAVSDLRREMRLERERARQAEARQRRQLEQTRRAADAAVMTAESVAENQKSHMAGVMKAAETRTETMEMLIPAGKKKKQQTEAAYTAADVAEGALVKISEMVPGATGDLEEQQEMLRKRRFDRHAARLGQISAAASALAIATVHSNAARLQAEKEKNSKAAQTEDQLDKFLYAKVMTDYFLPAVLLSPEDKAAMELKRKREALAAAEASRRWTLACEKEGSNGRSSEYWLLRRESLDTEAVSLKVVAVSFSECEKVTLKAIRKNFKSELQVGGSPPGYLGHSAIATITSSVGDAEKRAGDALQDVHDAFRNEIESGQRNGFLSENERVELDARSRRLVALLDALLQDFKRECVAVCDGPPESRDAAAVAAQGTAPKGIFADVMKLLEPAAARLMMKARRIRADAASLSADQSIPMKHTLLRADQILETAIPKAVTPLLPALRAARAMGKVDPLGIGALLINVDAADATVSAAISALAPAVQFAVWQLRNAPVGPATGPGASKKMKPLRPDDPTEVLAEVHDTKQKLDDALEAVGAALRQSRRRLLVETARAKQEVLRVIAGDLTHDKETAKNSLNQPPPPPIPARVANGVLNVTIKLKTITEKWGKLLDEAALAEADARGGAPERLTLKCRSVTDSTPRAIRDAGDNAKQLMLACTEIYFPVLGGPPPPPPPPANNAIPFLHLEEKTWKKGDEAEEIPPEPPEIGFLELEKEVDAVCDGIFEVADKTCSEIESVVQTILESTVFTSECADPNDADGVKPCTRTELHSVKNAAITFGIEITEAMDDMREDAKDAAQIVKKSALPAFFDYDEDYEPILNRKGKCEDPDLEIPRDHRVNALDCANAGTRIKSAEQEAREKVEKVLTEAKATLTDLFERAEEELLGSNPLLWRVTPEPQCPGPVTLGVPEMPSTVPFCGSSAGLSQFESAAEISNGLHEAEIAEAKRVMDREAAEMAAAAEAEAQKDAEAIMPVATPQKEPKRVKPAANRQLPPKATLLPNRNFYENMRKYFDEETGVKTLKRGFLEIVPNPGGGASGIDHETSEDLMLLNVQQLREIVQEAVPDVTAREMRHFEVLTLPGGDGVEIDNVKVTLTELRAAIRGSQRAHKAARYRASTLGSAQHSGEYDPSVQSKPPPVKLTGGLNDVLTRMRTSLEEEQIPTKSLFQAFDSDKDGKLDAGELKDMVWRLLPGLNPDEVRFAMAHFFEHISFEEGEISYSEALSDAIAAGEDGNAKIGTVVYRNFDQAMKALVLGKEEDE